MNVLSIAAHNSSILSKRSADYICDGTDDSAQLAALFFALPEIGGIVAFSEGEFLLNEPIVYPAKPLILRGQGALIFSDDEAQATKLKFSFASEGDCVTFDASNIGQCLERLALIGDDTYTRHGIKLDNGAALKTARDVNITGVIGSGVKGDSGNSQNYFERALTRDLAQGFSMYGNANIYLACEATRSSVAGLGGDWGFRLQETGSIYIACTTDKYTDGFQIVSYADGVVLNGCCAEVCGVSLAIGGDPTPTSTRIYGFNSISAQHGSFGAVRVFGSQATLLSGVNIAGSVSELSLEIGEDAVTLLVHGGRLDDNTPYTCEQGAVARIEDCSAQGQWLDWTSM